MREDEHIYTSFEKVLVIIKLVMGLGAIIGMTIYFLETA